MPALGESVTEGHRHPLAEGGSATASRSTSRCSRSRPTRSTPRSRRRSAGVLEEILVQEDETVAVGADLAVIGDGAAPRVATPAASSPTSRAPARATRSPTSPTVTPSRRRPTRAARSRPSRSRGAAPQAEPAQQEQPAAAPAPTASGDAGGSGDGTTVTLPALGESVTEGTVTRWLKAVGDEVAVDEPLLEVSTDKVDTEIPSPVAGTLSSRSSSRRTRPLRSAPTSRSSAAPVAAAQSAPEPAAEPAPAAAGARARSAGRSARGARPQQEDSAPEPAPAPAAPTSAAPAASEAPAAAAPAAPAASDERDAAAYVTPLVRKLAADNGVDLGSVTGTGVGGRIRKQDVLAAAEAAKAPRAGSPPPQRPQAPAAAGSGRRTVGQPRSGARPRRCRACARPSPPDGGVAAGLGPADHRRRGRRHPHRRGCATRAKGDFAPARGRQAHLPAVLRAGRRRGPQGPPDGQREHRGRRDHLPRRREPRHRGRHREGPAGAGASRTPATSTSPGLARKIADLAERTRNNKIRPDELAGGTFTITNTGSRGALFDTPIINQPQVAILGTGAIVKRPIVVTAEDGETIAIRSMVLPRAVLRPPHRRRCGRRPLPHDDEAATRGRRLRGRPRSLTGRLGTS